MFMNIFHSRNADSDVVFCNNIIIFITPDNREYNALLYIKRIRVTVANNPYLLSLH